MFARARNIQPAVSAALALAATGCAWKNPGPDGAVRARPVSISYSQPIGAVDPHQFNVVNSTQGRMLLALWEGLVTWDAARGEVRPAAAERWTVSADRREFVFTLRPDAQWSNGEPVTADDFLFAWRRATHGRGNAAGAFAALKDARSPDVRTLVVELAQPSATFLLDVCGTAWLPLHTASIGAIDAGEYWRRPETLVTNGAYQLARAGVDGFVLRANPHYWARATVAANEVRLVYADDPRWEFYQASAGVVQFTSPLPEMERWIGRAPPAPLAVDRHASSVLAVVTLNTRAGPLRDVRVRRALSLALARGGKFAEASYVGMTPAFGWVPPMPGRPAQKILREDVDEARRLLAAAGYPGGRGLPVLRWPLSLNYAGQPFPFLCAERWFAELGVRTYLFVEPPEHYRERMRAGDFDLIYRNWIGTKPDPADFLEPFASSDYERFNGWRDDEVNAWLRDAELADGAQRVALLDRVERRVLDELPEIPLLFASETRLRDPALRGADGAPVAWQPLQNLRLASQP